MLVLGENYGAYFVCHQERFERDQQRIRAQYEEEKRRAREAEQRKQQQVHVDWIVLLFWGE